MRASLYPTGSVPNEKTRKNHYAERLKKKKGKVKEEERLASVLSKYFDNLAGNIRLEDCSRNREAILSDSVEARNR